jgi:predicted DNA-binding transcriptional regulator AlpA
MARKREIERCYRPDYLSAESLAYRLDLSRSTIDEYVKRGLLPKPVQVGAALRYRWSDVESFIATANGELAPINGNVLSGEEDAFSSGIKNVSASHA